ncbi:MAG: hypothetical protein OEZ38_07815 [Gammaproteobacteria bacterium]|nr:hypothetical protein [Gammaproteobacteria bacterium]
MTLKEKFLNAIIAGELGTPGDYGAIVNLADFKHYFKDIGTDYVNSFMPAAVIETGQYAATHTRFLFRVKRGVYRVHPDAIAEQSEKNLMHPVIREPSSLYIRTGL